VGDDDTESSQAVKERDVQKNRPANFKSHNCIARAGESDWVGKLDGTIKSVSQISFSLNRVCLGDPSLSVRIRIPRPGRSIAGEDRGSFFEVGIQVCAGLLGDEDQGKYQIENFTAAPLEESPEDERPKTFDLTTRNLSSPKRISFNVYGAHLKGWDQRDDIQNAADESTFKFLEIFCGKACGVDLVFLDDRRSQFDEYYAPNFKNAIDQRLIPLHQYYTSGNLNVSIDMESYATLRNRLWSKLSPTREDSQVSPSVPLPVQLNKGVSGAL
jgi:hypothetical protein